MRRFGSLVLVFGLVFAACGDSDETSSDTTAGDGDSSTTIDLSDLGGAFGSEECLEAAQAMAAAVVGVGGAFSGQVGDLDDSVAQLEAAADAAPDEIKDDLETIAKGYSEFLEAIQDADFDPSSGQPPDAATVAALEEASKKLDDSDFQEAADRVNAFFEGECKD